MEGPLLDEVDDPRFDCANRVHDWRNHVGVQTREVWQTFTIDQKVALAMDAYAIARNENWE